jgi:hypothetical protein
MNNVPRHGFVARVGLRKGGLQGMCELRMQGIMRERSGMKDILASMIHHSLSWTGRIDDRV